MQVAAERFELTVAKPRLGYFKFFLRSLYLVSLSLYVYFLIDGLEYYQIPLQERPHHTEYRSLRPAGLYGQGFGVIGGLMMLFMLLYSIRKRTRLFGNWGKLSRWLDIHTYFGVMGPLLIILHTSFKVEGLVAVAFWAMIAVALSGVVGRYLYKQIPRTPDGVELSLKDISTLNKSYYRDLQSSLNLSDQQIALLDEMIAVKIAKKESLLGVLLKYPLRSIFHPFRIRATRRQIRRVLGLEEPYLYKTVHLVWRQINLQRRAKRLNQVQQLFHYWHVFHKPFAIILYVIMFIHIGVAVWLGYTWIF